jgi:hypothetical protein
MTVERFIVQVDSDFQLRFPDASRQARYQSLINLLFQTVQIIHPDLLIEVASNGFAIHHLIQVIAGRFNGLPGHSSFNQNIKHRFGGAFITRYLERKVGIHSFNGCMPCIFIRQFERCFGRWGHFWLLLHVDVVDIRLSHYST